MPWNLPIVANSRQPESAALCHDRARRFDPEAAARLGEVDGISVSVTQSMDGAGAGLAAPVTYLVIAHAPDGSVLDTIATLPGPRLGSVPQSGGFVTPLFDAVSLATARSATVAMTTAREPQVRLLDGDFGLRHIVRWADPDREVAGAHAEAFREDYIAEHGGRGSRGWSPAHEAQVSDGRPVAELFPTASDLMIGRDGRLWVKRYARPREEASWMAFGERGYFSCHLRPGSELTPLEFGADSCSPCTATNWRWNGS